MYQQKLEQENGKTEYKMELIKIDNCEWIQNSYRSIPKWDSNGKKIFVPQTQQFLIKGKKVWIPRKVCTVEQVGSTKATVSMPVWLYRKTFGMTNEESDMQDYIRDWNL